MHFCNKIQTVTQYRKRRQNFKRNLVEIPHIILHQLFFKTDNDSFVFHKDVNRDTLIRIKFIHRLW